MLGRVTNHGVRANHFSLSSMLTTPHITVFYLFLVVRWVAASLVPSNLISA